MESGNHIPVDKIPLKRVFSRDEVFLQEFLDDRERATKYKEYVIRFSEKHKDEIE